MDVSVFRVYRKDIDILPGWWGDLGYREVFVVAEDEFQAKEIALHEFRSLIGKVRGGGEMPKENILVKKIELKAGIILGTN